MYKYQYSVSREGNFLFRTDMISSYDNPTEVTKELTDRFPKEEGFAILENRYEASYRSIKL
jgi:hypothetical protein